MDRESPQSRPRDEPTRPPETPAPGDSGKGSEPLIPDVLEPGEEYRERQGGGAPFGGGDSGGMFQPRSMAGGRVQVVGCSPGCLILSLVVSVVLSIVLTLLLNLIF